MTANPTHTGDYAPKVIAQLRTSIPQNAQRSDQNWLHLQFERARQRSERDFVSEGKRTPSSVTPPCTYLAMSRFASYYFWCHVLDGATERVGPFLLQPGE